jgi:hypothetical protein
MSQYMDKHLATFFYAFWVKILLDTIKGVTCKVLIIKRKNKKSKTLQSL